MNQILWARFEFGKNFYFWLLEFGSNSLSFLVWSRFYNPWVSQWQALLVEGRSLSIPMYSTSFSVHPLTQYQKNLALSPCEGLNIMASYCSYKRCKKTCKNVVIFKSQKRNINYEYFRRKKWKSSRHFCKITIEIIWSDSKWYVKLWVHSSRCLICVNVRCQHPKFAKCQSIF